MPTYDKLARFLRDYKHLTAEQRLLFKAALKEFIEDLGAQNGVFRSNLRIKRIQTAEGIFEMSWAPNGRATFEYGESVHPGETHIIWRRIEYHSILRNP